MRLAPPAQNGFGAPEFVRCKAIQNAENIDIRTVLVPVVGSSGAVEDDRNELRTEALFEALDKIV